MSVFNNYDPHKAGDVNANALPQVHPKPWTPTQRNIRANPNIPSQPQRIQPHERGTFFNTSATGSGTLAPQMSSGCSGCGGGCGNGIPQVPTASQLATGNTQPSSTNGLHPGASGLRNQMKPAPAKAVATPRVPSRATGTIARPKNPVGTASRGPMNARAGSVRMMPMAFLGGRGTRT